MVNGILSPGQGRGGTQTLVSLTMCAGWWLGAGSEREDSQIWILSGPFPCVMWCECAAHNYLESGYCDMTGDTVWGKSAHSTGWTAIKTSKIQQWQSNCGILLNSGELAATVSKCQFGPGLPSPSRRDQTQFIIPGGRREVPLQVFVETANWDNKPIIVIVTI